MLFVDFISWWYADGLKGFMQRLGLQLAKITDFFSVGLLIKTLFTPFRLIDSYSADGQSLDDKIRAGLDKLIARFIGGLIRSTVLLFAIIVILLHFKARILKLKNMFQALIKLMLVSLFMHYVKLLMCH